MGCCVLSGEHTFSEEQKGDARRVQIWSQRETASRRHKAGVGLGATSFELDDNRCVEVKQRAVLSAEESQRETASDTP